MYAIDFDQLRTATVFHEPFPFLIAANVVRPETAQGLRHDFPAISGGGIYPLQELNYGPVFTALIDDLLGPETESILGEALQVPLGRHECLVTVRGRCRARDGAIHTDSSDKVATLLLYLNDPSWDNDGGRLRFLRDPGDINSVIAEVPPAAGTLVAFRRTDNSWHGHLPYEGERRLVMVNWMVSEAAAQRERARHTFSSRIKALTSWLH